MAALNRHKKTLLLLSKACPKLAKKIIAKADNSLIKAISEVCLNVLHGVIPLSSAKKKRIGKFKDKLRFMAGNEKISEKRSALQAGGFLGALASIALPLIFQGVTKIAASIRARKARQKRRT